MSKRVPKARSLPPIRRKAARRTDRPPVAPEKLAMAVEGTTGDTEAITPAGVALHERALAIQRNGGEWRRAEANGASDDAKREAPAPKAVLVAVDDCLRVVGEVVLEICRDLLAWPCRMAMEAVDTLALLADRTFDVGILVLEFQHVWWHVGCEVQDAFPPGMNQRLDRLEWMMKRAKALRPELKIIVIAVKHHGPALAERAVRGGAFDLVYLPLNLPFMEFALCAAQVALR